MHVPQVQETRSIVILKKARVIYLCCAVVLCVFYHGAAELFLLYVVVQTYPRCCFAGNLAFLQRGVLISGGLFGSESQQAVNLKWGCVAIRSW